MLNSIARVTTVVAVIGGLAMATLTSASSSEPEIDVEAIAEQVTEFVTFRNSLLVSGNGQQSRPMAVAGDAADYLDQAEVQLPALRPLLEELGEEYTHSTTTIRDVEVELGESGEIIVEFVEDTTIFYDDPWTCWRRTSAM